MNRKWTIGLSAFVLVTAAAATASAQEERGTFLDRRVAAPKQAYELTIGTGYTQGFGRLAGGPGNAVNDVAAAGIGVDLGLGYRLSPYWMLGLAGEYQEFGTGSKALGVEPAMDSNSAARGMLAGIDATFHVQPYTRLDPWVRLGTGYRFLWEVHSPQPTYLYHGLDIARLTLGADFRMSPDVAVAPVVGADLNLFLWKDGANAVAIGDNRLSTFFYAGLQARFDMGGARVPEEPLPVVSARR